MGRKKRTYGEERLQRRLARQAQQQRSRAAQIARINQRVEELIPWVVVPPKVRDETPPITVTPFARRCAAQTVHYRLPEASQRKGVTIDAQGKRHYAIDGQPVSYQRWYKAYALRVETPHPSKVRAKTVDLMTDEQRAEFDACRMAAQQEQQRLKQEQRRLKQEQQQQQQQERQRMKRAQAREQRRLAREQARAQKQEQRRLAQEHARAQRQEQRRLAREQSQERRREYLRQYNLKRREQNRAYCREYWKKRRMQQQQQQTQEQGA